MMRRLTAAFALLLLAATPAMAQSGCSSIVNGAVLTAGQWQSCFQAKNDVLGFVPLNRAGGTMTGLLITAPSTTTNAGLRLGPGAAPSAPVDGDTWTTTSGMFVRINGVTIGPLGGATSSSFAATSPVTVSFPAGVVTYAWNFSVANTWLANQTVSLASGASPGWYAQVNGDTTPRVRVGVNANDVASIGFGPGNAVRDAFIERVGAASLRHGGPDAASPVAQTISVQNVVAGTSNTAGANLTIAGSQGTGNAAGGSIIFKVAPAGTSGTSQNALATAATLASNGNSIPDIIALGLRDTSAAFDLTVAATSSTALTAGRTLTFDVVNAARTVKLGANLTIATDPGSITGALKSNGTGTFSQAACADLSNATFCAVSLTNGITLGNIAQVAAFSLLGNTTGSTANLAAFTIGGLTQKVSPASSDLLLIQDQAASGALKYATVSSIASAGSVSSIDSKTGAFTTSNGLDSTGGNVIELTAARRTLPTVQKFVSGSGTYTTPANVLWIDVLVVGAGGGGGGSGTGNTVAAAGGNSTFSTLTAGGGALGGDISAGAAGGTATGGDMNINGGVSGGSFNLLGSTGGNGGSTCLGGEAGVTASGNNGSHGATNSGGGGSGGYGASSTSWSAAGGGGGACVRKIITSPGATFSYAVGAAGAGGGAGTGGGAGGNGGSGFIMVIEHYGSWIILVIGWRRRRAANDNNRESRRAA